MELFIVDVFAERALSGNQLAVVRGAAHLTTADMQDIAREMNFSETTFVLEESPDRARVRIFTPEWELPFAGHPTLGTAWVLGRQHKLYILDLDAGAVPVTFEGDLAWMVPPAVRFSGTLDSELAARLIRLDPDDLHADFPVRLAEVGRRFVLIGVRDLATLRRARLDEAVHRDCLERGLGVQCVFVFSPEPYADSAQFSARMFFESGGVREDPATGSANTAFAAYLQDRKWPDPVVVVDQGVEVRRPSRLYLELGEPLRVGGKVRAVVQGQLLI